ncbi:MAG: hypothetical protein H7203_11840 [Rhizobacter sp.]|nr:hypothetical protein [Burkholderiales bacterium]
MDNFRCKALWVTAIALVALSSTGANAQATRTWVSGVGDDVNPCSRTAPCKTFAGAISKTAAGGEISVLDPGGFGAITITKSMTINGDGTLAAITNPFANGIVINAGVADVVHLRRLSIMGAGTGISGVRVLQAGQVTIEDLTISGNTVNGVDINTTADTNVVLRNVGIRGAANGVSVQTSSGSANVTLDGVHIQQVTTGVNAAAGAVLAIDRSNVSSNSTGILSSSNAVVRLSDSTITMNGTGLSATTGGQIVSYNNNRLRGNTTDGAPTSTVYQR